MANDEGFTESSQNASLSICQSFLDVNSSVEFVRFQWIDFTTTMRTQLVTVRQARHLAAQESTISLPSPITSAFLLDGSFNERTPGSKDSLVPDWSTLVVCQYQPSHAAVLCFVDQGGRRFDCCLRSLLKKVEREVKEQHGFFISVGVEIEFNLMQSADLTTPVKDVATYCATASLRTPYLAVLEDSVLAIEQAKIPVWNFHSETMPGLFEISTDPMSPLRAADALGYVHEAIKAFAVKHGLHAALHPKPFDSIYGVGQHMHISFSSNANEDSFLAGVLDSVPAISAISIPNFDSYLRSVFAGGDWVSWDTKNRFSSIHKIRSA